MIKKRVFLIGMALMALLLTLPVAAQETGKASYYAKYMTGRRTSSGLRFHNDSLFCAHKKHPFGTLLKVVNPRNGNSVVVKVIDRGPHTKGRIVDLSVRAARELGILAQGIATVEVSVYHPEKSIPYKLEPEVEELPELDFEFSEGEGYEPAWKTEQQKKAAEQQTASHK